MIVGAGEGTQGSSSCLFDMKKGGDNPSLLQISYGRDQRPPGAPEASTRILVPVAPTPASKVLGVPFSAIW